MDYYGHTIKIYKDYAFNDLELLESILSSGYLLSRRNLGVNSSYGFNGMDYISLCDMSMQESSYSAYNMYIKNGLSLLFDKSIKVIEPTFLYIDNMLPNFSDIMKSYGLEKERYSDLMDEVQVKDSLSLDYLKAISLPINRFLKFHSKEYFLAYLKMLKTMLINYDKNVPIINIDTKKEIKIKE